MLSPIRFFERRLSTGHSKPTVIGIVLIVQIVLMSPIRRCYCQENLDTASEKVSVSDFSGQWDSTFGVLLLTQTGEAVKGTYPLGILSGRVQGNTLVFNYFEPTLGGAGVNGVGKFTLNKSATEFSGRWRQKGRPTWQQWNATKLKAAAGTGLSGLWETTFGRMRLNVEEDEVRGEYLTAAGIGQVTGTRMGNELALSFKQGDKQGDCKLRLSEDKTRLSGTSQLDGDSKRALWSATRVAEKTDEVWLVVLEANWETRLEEPQYAFGEMLEQYFRMALAQHVKFRHRYFHDEEDLARFCREVQFISGQVVLLISTHGNPNGIVVNDDLISADELGLSLVNASNIVLLHLSGCSMMASNFPQSVQKVATGASNMAVSGYKTVVGWDSSAIADFTYLSLVLLRGLAPVEAVAKSVEISAFMGDSLPADSTFKPLGLSAIAAPNPTQTQANASHAN